MLTNIEWTEKLMQMYAGGYALDYQKVLYYLESIT